MTLYELFIFLTAFGAVTAGALYIYFKIGGLRTKDKS